MFCHGIEIHKGTIIRIICIKVIIETISSEPDVTQTKGTERQKK